MSQWTKKAIMESFERMINEQPLDRITVKSIVADCGVTRNTFYYHFEDIYALAKEVLITQLEEMGAQYGPNDWEAFILLLARQSAKHKRTIKNLFRSSKSDELSRFISDMVNHAMNLLFDHLAEGKEVPPESRRLIIDFYRHSLAGIAEHWLNQSDEEDPEALVHQISLLLQGGMKQAIQNAELLQN